MNKKPRILLFLLCENDKNWTMKSISKIKMNDLHYTNCKRKTKNFEFFQIFFSVFAMQNIKIQCLFKFDNLHYSICRIVQFLKFSHCINPQILRYRKTKNFEFFQNCKSLLFLVFSQCKNTKVLFVQI